MHVLKMNIFSYMELLLGKMKKTYTRIIAVVDYLMNWV